MKEKTWKKLYFSAFLLLLFLIIFISYYNIQKENSLNAQIENSYQEMINNTKNNMFQEYQIKYGLSEEDFEEYWKDFETSEEFRILEAEYKEEYGIRIRNELSELGFTKQWFKILGLNFLKFVVFLIPTTTKGLVLTIGLIFGFYFLLKWLYSLFIPKNILKKNKK